MHKCNRLIFTDKRQTLFRAAEKIIAIKRNMDSRKSPAEWNSSQNPETGQPLLSLQHGPPEYSGAGLSPSHNFPSSFQQYGAPVASGLYTPGSCPVQNVVTMQPTAEVFTPLANPLPDYLGYSIFTLLCCCMPLGSAALVYSLTVSIGSYTCLIYYI